MFGHDEMYRLLETGMRQRSRPAVELVQHHATQLGFFDLAWVAEGWLHLEQRAPRRAVDALRRAQEVNPISLLVLDLLAQALARDRQPSAAMDVWERVMLRGNDAARCLALSRRAEVHFQLGDDEKGLASLRLALALDESQAGVWVQLLRHIASRPDVDAAERLVEEARTRVGMPKAREEMEAVLREAGQNARPLEKERWLRLADAISEEPGPRVRTTEDAWRAYARLANAAAETGDAELAGTRLATALTLARTDEYPRVLEQVAEQRTPSEVQRTIRALNGRRLPPGCSEVVRRLAAPMQ